MKKQEVINALVASAKLDIINFIDAYKAKGEEIQINGFSDLHDYYDANEYVFDLSDDFESANKVIEELHNWIKESIAKQDSQIEKQEAINIIKQFYSVLNYVNLRQEVDANAETENFGLEFKFSDVTIFLLDVSAKSSIIK